LSNLFSLALLAIIVFVASTKSAQLPFSSWLPAAMAAPTPVSSLVHSSTLVTAGVYLLIRINYLLAIYEALWGISLLGAVTMCIAGIRAIGEVDIKKVVALSTLSQLGLMFMTLGIGLPLLAFFHLAAHAYFKAIIFMCAGGIIHRIKEYQDLRTLGGAANSMPISISVFLVANLRLCGLPFMAGFFSKDLILELLIMRRANVIMFVLSMLATMLTVLYSLRATIAIFAGHASAETGSSVSESDSFITLSILILLAPSVMGGLGIS
jgi:NADH-ubiquinone oxidoreductase chain 5